MKLLNSLRTARAALAYVLPATRAERWVALWSFGYFFTLLAGYYVLRPLRDQMGIAGGVKKLPLFFLITFLVMLLAQPIYWLLVTKLPRVKFITLVYHFSVFNLLLFWLLLTFDFERALVARIFFVWVTVFGLFAIAVFWSFMADVYSAEQAKRLFGFIGAGGTAGSIVGPLLILGLSSRIGTKNLLIIAGVLIELAVLCVHRIERLSASKASSTGESGPALNPGAQERQKVGGSVLEGLRALLTQPYLQGIALWVSLLSFGATFTYMAQANFVAQTVHGAAQQTKLFAGVDLIVTLLSLATQVFITARLLKRFGAGIAACALPVAYLLGFAALAARPHLLVVVILQVVQRWMNFALANPARHLFFTVVGRQEKYTAKNAIDVVVYRGSDALYSWLFEGLKWLGLKLGAIALLTLPVSALWMLLSLALGRSLEQRAATTEKPRRHLDSVQIPHPQSPSQVHISLKKQRQE